MQQTSATFKNIASANMRPLKIGVFISFLKTYNAGTNFWTQFTKSSLGNFNIYSGGVGGVVQEWDKYNYQDYSNRIISAEWTQQVEKVASVTMATADIVLDNHDDFFTPGGLSSISSYILPSRPIKLFAGFGDEVIPVFTGFTDGMPTIDKKSKTISFHCIDALSSLMNYPLVETYLDTDIWVSDVLIYLLNLAGLSASQLANITQSETKLSYFYATKDKKLGSVISELMNVEQGRIYLDEYGIIRFYSRANYANNNIASFDVYNSILEANTKSESDLINVVEIKGTIKEEQPIQPYWRLQQSILIPLGSSIDVWVDFQDPVTDVDDPVDISIATTSYLRANTNSDGSGVYSVGLTLSSSYVFAQSYKMTFTNNSTTDLYITELVLFAKPVISIQDLYIREQNDSSVAIYDEKVLTINSDFFQSESEAKSKALVILDDYSNYNTMQEIIVKGDMSLQIDDQIKIDIFGRIGNYKIIKIRNTMSQPAQFKQILTVKDFTPKKFFTIGSSYITSTDSIRP